MGEGDFATRGVRVHHDHPSSTVTIRLDGILDGPVSEFLGESFRSMDFTGCRRILIDFSHISRYESSAVSGLKDLLMFAKLQSLDVIFLGLERSLEKKFRAQGFHALVSFPGRTTRKIGLPTY